MTTLSEASDIIFGAFKTDWDLYTTSVCGYIPEIRWQNIEGKEPPPNNKFWVHVSQEIVETPQVAFDGGLGRLYTTYGLIYVKLFCPKTDAEAMSDGRLLAEIAQRTFRKRHSTVVFKNSVINELPTDINYYRFNIIAEYEFDDRS